MAKENAKYTIFVVEDDTGLSHLVQRRLQREGYQINAAASGKEAALWIRSNHADLMLLDYKLLDMTGKELVKLLRDENILPPFIMVTGQGDEKLAVEMMKEGSRDYIMKEGAFLELLPAVIAQVISQLDQETKLIEAQNTLHDSEARYRGMFNSSLDAVFIVDFDGNIIDANPQATKIFGYTPAEFYDLNIPDLIHIDHRKRYEKNRRAIQEQGEFQIETIGTQKDRTTIDVEIRGSLFEYKGNKNFIIVFRDISERKWSEEEIRLTNQQLRISERALRERESRLRAIFQGAAIGMSLVDLRGRALESNETLQEMLGYSRAELRQKGFLEFVCPEDRQSSSRLFEDLANGRCNRYQMEIRLSSKNQCMVWGRIIASLVRGTDGEPNYIIIMIEEITDHKKNEIELRESDSRFRLLSEAAFEGILIHEKGTILDINTAFEIMFGYNRDELIGTDSLKLIAPEDRQLVAENIRQEYVDAPYEAKGIRKDGTDIFMIISARMMPFHGRNVRVVAIRDITEQKNAQDALQESEAKYRRLFEKMLSGFAYHRIIMDDNNQPIDYEYLEINDAFENLTGIKREDIIGKRFSEVFPRIKDSGYDWIENYGEVALTGKEIAIEQYIEEYDRWFYISAYSPKTGFFATVFNDVTERRMLAEELRMFATDLERSNRELDQFAEVVSSDLKYSLNDIQSSCENLESSYRRILDPTGISLLDKIHSRAEYMQKMIDEIQVYSRVETRGKPFAEVDLNQVAGQIKKKLAEVIKSSQGLREISPLPKVWADQEQLEQLLEHLISNAFKFRSKVPPQVKIEAEEKDNIWQITVQDNGIGIVSEDQERIFNMFRRLHSKQEYPGNGIGLSLCQKVIDHHGGRIWVESAPGTGSKFHFTLPTKSH